MKKPLLNIICAILLVHLGLQKCYAQPYIDVINIRYAKSPDAGFFQHNKKATDLNYFNASATLPVLFHNKKDALIFSPFFGNGQQVLMKLLILKNIIIVLCFLSRF